MAGGIRPIFVEKVLPCKPQFSGRCGRLGTLHGDFPLFEAWRVLKMPCSRCGCLPMILVGGPSFSPKF
jgi:hypothetical protein